jgi:hypothetical protein
LLKKTDAQQEASNKRSFFKIYPDEKRRSQVNPISALGKISVIGGK